VCMCWWLLRLMNNSSGEWSKHRVKMNNNSCRDQNSWLGVVPTRKLTVDYPINSAGGTAVSMCGATFLGKFAWGQEFLVSKTAAMHGRVVTAKELQRICKAIKIWSASLVAAVWSRLKHNLHEQTAVKGAIQSWLNGAILLWDLTSDGKTE